MPLSVLVASIIACSLGCSIVEAQTGSLVEQKSWPQSSGPNGNWIVDGPDEVPIEFSVRTGKNILWEMDLPESGQGGLTIWDDRIFLSVMKPIVGETERKDLATDTIVALCVDAKKQEIVWQHEMQGMAKSPYLYGFSNSTTPAPITDGKRVWFFNASGRITCFDIDGEVLWERKWRPVEDLAGVHYPFNKQFEPILYGDLLINMETYWEQNERRVNGWNYLIGIDKNTGKEVWISEDSLTHYNTPGFSQTRDNKAAMLIGRGGYHKVPEKPKGYSLIDLEDGKSIWRYETDEGTALFNSTWNQEQALWFTETDNVIHKLDADTGRFIEEISLADNVTLRKFNVEENRYETRTTLNVPGSPNTVVWPAWYTNIIVGQKCYFMCFTNKHRRLKHTGPQYCFGRIDLNTGKAEYLAVPVQYELVGKEKKLLWQVDVSNETNNIRGIDVAYDPRSKRDGWAWNFNANPICINGKLFFTTMTGIVYCFDTSRELFDEKALVSVNDLGPKGQTWTLNTPSFSNGKLFHRTSKHLICIGRK